MKIRHVEEHGRFQVTVDGHGSYLYYQLPQADLMDIQSVFVPRVLRGRSIGKALAEHAIDYARAHDMQVQPTCPYVRWLMENSS